MNRFLSALFPYRVHLEREVEYLRGQLAQKERRIDEMLEAMKPAPVAPRAPREAAKPLAPAVLGWDAYRLNKRNQPAEQEKKEAKNDLQG